MLMSSPAHPPGHQVAIMRHEGQFRDDPGPGVEGAVVHRILERAGEGSWEAWQRQARATGYCSRPVRLRGRRVDAESGEVVFDSAGQPDGVLMVRCGTRRAALCPSCSYEYAGDLWQLLYAGLAGGRKGVPRSEERRVGKEC